MNSAEPIQTSNNTQPTRSSLHALRIVILAAAVLFLAAIAAFFYARHWTRQAMRDALPQLDGSLAVSGLAAPVTVQRDAHGVPHLRAASLDDLVFAQGYITAADRLWQMETLRRHASGTLAEILGVDLLKHDRQQRILQLVPAADRALAILPADQLHWLTIYANGVNASIAAQSEHLPLEFRLLRFTPAPWTPRDSLLVALVMFQDLTNTFPDELNREALTAKLPLNLQADLYPTGSWRDHPAAQPAVDLTAPQPDLPDIPLDESQTGDHAADLTTPAHIRDLLDAHRTLAPVLACDGCKSGSNNWVVSGSHTATGKPLLANDMHLGHSVPGIWYQADLEAPTPTGVFHVAGVSLPGAPFIVVGHNDHIAWGFTNLGATVQDISIEHIRGSGPNAEYQASSTEWQPVLHRQETIRVKGGKDVSLDLTATQHGNIVSPIISAIFPTEKRSLSLRWTLYDPANITAPFFAVNSATGWPDLHAAFADWGGPAQNLVFADDQGHIGYHAVGKIPIRGSIDHPTPIPTVPTDALDPAQQWAGYIPFDQLPQSFDPANGFLATANARVTPDDYPFPITLDWAAPYRNERIWKLLAERALATHDHLTPTDMLAIQTDIYSDVDHVIAQRLAYAIDHTTTPALTKDKRLHQAADLLRDWNGNVDADAAAPAIVDAAREAFWPMLLNPQLGPNPGSLANLYTWGSKSYAQEWLIMHTPSRWLPSTYPTWDDLLASTVLQGLKDAHAPGNLSKWHYGKANPVDIEHPIFHSSPILQRLITVSTGTGEQPQSGDHSTIKQVARTFGPSERFTADLANPDHSTLNLVLGESGNPASPWFKDQWPAWYQGTTHPTPYTQPATNTATTHTLILTLK